MLKPLFKIASDKRLSARTACQSNPVSAAFAVQSKIDVEERATDMFPGGPLSDQLKSGSICRELKLIAVGQFGSLEHQPTQFWPQLIEMPFALFGIEGQTVTGKRRFVRGRDSQKRKYHNQQKYSHESTLRLKPEFKSSADFHRPIPAKTPLPPGTSRDRVQAARSEFPRVIGDPPGESSRTSVISKGPETVFRKRHKLALMVKPARALCSLPFARA